MKSKNRLSQKFALDRRYFFALSLLAVGLFVLAWFYPESFPSKTSLLPRGIVMDQGDLLWSLFFLSSFISLDSKAPTKPYREFLEGEVRYTSLKKLFPERAEALYEAAERNAKERYENYERLNG